MGIDLRWEDENGKQLEEVLDPQMYISALVLNADLTGTICLKFIDPYGDTTFNQRQIPVLIEEVKAILKRVSDDGMQSHLRHVLGVAERSSGAVHTYLKFYGD